MTNSPPNLVDSLDSTKPTDSTSRFEDSITALEAVITQLEQGDLSLESSLAQFEKGIALARNCQTLLTAAEQKVEIITSSGINQDDSQ